MFSDFKWVQYSKNEMGKIKETLSSLKMARGLIGEKKTKEIKQRVGGLESQLVEFQKEAGEGARMVMSQLESKIKAMKEGVMKEREAIDESGMNAGLSLEEEIKRLSEQIKAEDEEREIHFDKMISGFGNRLVGIRGKMALRRQENKQTQQKISEYLVGIRVQTMKEIENEERIRREAQGRLLRLLEMTCEKMQNHILVESDY